MKPFAVLVLVVFAAGFCGSACAESNPVAKSVETVTHAPFAGAMTVSDHLFSPVKEASRGAFDITDKARGWVVSTGLNLGQPVE